MSSANHSSIEFAIEAAHLLDDRHCEDVRLLDVRGLSQVCDYILLGSGTSDRQMRAVAAELEDLGSQRGSQVFRSSRDDGGTWIVVDFVDLVAHLFEPSQRGYYDLESLWSDADVIDWKQSNGSTIDRAASGARRRQQRSKNTGESHAS